jgi:predicted dienelactone hydrolase
VDAPSLAALGPYGVGVRTVSFVEHAVPDPLHLDPATGKAPLVDRVLEAEAWYPARTAKGAVAVTYAADFEGEHGRGVPFQTPGLAVRDAPPDAGGPYPLVILAHGYGGDPVAMSWLAENLASKGYVVVGARHRDPPYGDPRGFFGPALWRPLDIAFLARTVQAKARSSDPAFGGGLIDPDRVALVGYSMGGYGVVTAGGAGLAPDGAARAAPGNALAPYVRGGAKANAFHVDGLRAVVAIAPAGGSGPFLAWGQAGLAQLTRPLLVIVGDQDKTVGYAGPRAVFLGAVHAQRYLLTFHEGGHSIGMDGAAEAMRTALWDQDWFEDPVWRKERVLGVNLHFITAFLDLNLKDKTAMTSYLNVATPQSDDGVWPQPAPGAPYAAASPMTGGITVWKGFQRNHATGLSLERAAAQ